VPDGVAPPRVPNQDGAGVVDAVGEGVAGLAPGDRVWVWDAGYGRADGTAQEYVTMPRRQVVRMNDDVPFEVGADLGIPALTAHRCLTVAENGPDRLAPGALTGRTVLVAGGAGAVGNAAIQLARWAGAASGVYCLLYALAGAIIGMAAKVLLPALESRDDAFAQFVEMQLPPVLAGLVLAAALAAVMSTSSGALIATATVFSQDIVARLRKRDIEAGSEHDHIRSNR